MLTPLKSHLSSQGCRDKIQMQAKVWVKRKLWSPKLKGRNSLIRKTCQILYEKCRFCGADHPLCALFTFVLPLSTAVELGQEKLSIFARVSLKAPSKTLGDIQTGKWDCLTCKIFLLTRHGKGKTLLGLGQLHGTAVGRWGHLWSD